MVTAEEFFALIVNEALQECDECLLQQFFPLQIIYVREF
jgi:hypothetical protein